MIKPCEKHTNLNEYCPECIAYSYGVEVEDYYSGWIDIIGDSLGCGNNPLYIYRAIQEMILQEDRMKKMIANLRKRKEV